MATNNATKDDDLDVLKKDIDELRAAVLQLTKDLKGSAEARGASASQAAKAKIEEVGQKASEKGRETADAMVGTVREHPLQSVLIAFGAGLIISRLIGGRSDR